ncbi:hypothetical protein N9R54_06085 [Pelobium sp.]|nr:G8 domain-containing protein [Pelobium sp.]MDA9555786.1 hypothetical protein [Pelobium sp.]
MKQLYLSFILLCLAAVTNAATITAVSSASVTRPVTVTTGLKKWSQASSWIGGVVPNSATDDVVIPANAVILLDASINLSSLTIEGMLIVDITKPVLNISANDIMVMGTSGYFQWGLPTQRYTGDGTITLKGAESNGNTMGMGSKFLGAMDGGEIRIHGQDATSWTQLAQTANAGSSSITVRNKVKYWKKGDEIVIASTDFNMNQAEKKTIDSVSADRLTVFLSTPLTYKHFGVKQVYSQTSDANGTPVNWTLDESAEVGLLSKSITIQGDAQSETAGFGGHVMIMGTAKSFIANVAFYRMGQRYRKARYPFHWHNVTNIDRNQYIDSCSVYHTFNRAITVHATDNVFVRTNVAYDNLGHAYFMEDGTETGVTMTGNLGLVTRRPSVTSVAAPYFLLPSDIVDERNHSGPSTFWITNPNNHINNNHAAGSDGSGIWYAPFNNPNGVNYVASYQPLNMRIPNAGDTGYPTYGALDNNTMHSNKHGFILGAGPNAGDASEAPDQNRGVNVPPNSKPTLRNIVVFKNGLGAYTRTMPQNNQESYYDNFIVADNRVGDAATWRTYYNKVLWVVGSANASTNYPPGYNVGGNITAAHIIYDGPVMVTNSHFGGTTAAGQSMFDQWGANLKYGGHTFTNTTVNASAYKIHFRDDTDNDNLNPVWFLGSVRDIDGKLTGVANSTLSKNNPYLMPTTGPLPLPLIGDNGVRTGLNFGYVEATGSDHLTPQEMQNAPAGTSQRPDASILRSDGPQYTDKKAIQGYPITTILNDPDITHRLVLKEEIPARMRFDVYSQNENQDIVLEYPNVPPSIKVYTGDALNYSEGTNLVLINPINTPTMAALLAVSTAGTNYFWKDGTAYIRYKAPAGSDFTSDKKLESIFLCLYGNCDANSFTNPTGPNKNAPVIIADFNRPDNRGSVVKSSGTSSPTYTSSFGGCHTYTVNNSDMVGGVVDYTLRFDPQNWENVSNISVQFTGSPSGVLFIEYSDGTRSPLVVHTDSRASIGDTNTYASSVGLGTVYRKFIVPTSNKNMEVVGLRVRTRLSDLVMSTETVRLGEIRLGVPPSEGGLPTILNSNPSDLVTTNIQYPKNVNEKEFSVYPNPSTGLLKLSSSGKWKVYSLATGVEVKSGLGSSIDLASMPKGLYLIEMNNNYHKVIIH